MLKSGSPNSYWVIPGKLLAGSYPLTPYDENIPLQVNWLLEQGITFCLDLTEAGEYGLMSYAERYFEEAAVRGIPVVHQRISIPDMSTPTVNVMQHILDTIDNALESGHRVYVHCYGGIGRTGTVVGCHLVRHGMEGSEAIRHIARLRKNTLNSASNSPETAAQRQMILDWLNHEK